MITIRVKNKEYEFKKPYYLIPKVPKHDIALYPDGGNNKEYCKCEKCKELRKRRDSIYKQITYNQIKSLVVRSFRTTQ